MDIGKELSQCKKKAIIEWRKKNKHIDMNNVYNKVGILNEIRSAAAIKYFSINHKCLSNMSIETLVQHYDDITTILSYL